MGSECQPRVACPGSRQQPRRKGVDCGLAGCDALAEHADLRCNARTVTGVPRAKVLALALGGSSSDTLALRCKQAALDVLQHLAVCSYLVCHFRDLCAEVMQSDRRARQLPTVAAGWSIGIQRPCRGLPRQVLLVPLASRRLRHGKRRGWAPAARGELLLQRGDPPVHGLLLGAPAAVEAQAPGRSLRGLVRNLLGAAARGPGLGPAGLLLLAERLRTPELPGARLRAAAGLGLACRASVNSWWLSEVLVHLGQVLQLRLSDVQPAPTAGLCLNQAIEECLQTQQPLIAVP
mmetsp:Transcript_10990/g.34331  ORF Transcript_10990/g.34331 Transcript_10990/m.34331 type:complete len:291 (-) Transcript_10990:597-1469(-)